MREGSILDRGDRSGSRNDACLGPGVDGLTLGRQARTPPWRARPRKSTWSPGQRKGKRTGKRGAYPYILTYEVQALPQHSSSGRDSPGRPTCLRLSFLYARGHSDEQRIPPRDYPGWARQVRPATYTAAGFCPLFVLGCLAWDPIRSVGFHGSARCQTWAFVCFGFSFHA